MRVGELFGEPPADLPFRLDHKRHEDVVEQRLDHRGVQRPDRFGAFAQVGDGQQKALPVTRGAGLGQVHQAPGLTCDAHEPLQEAYCLSLETAHRW